MIDRESTLFDITEKHPETIPVFVSNGFPHMGDESKRAALGKSISLSSALLLKQLDIDTFTNLLEEAIRRASDNTDVTLAGSAAVAGADTPGPNVVGILPCPVRLPLMEKWNEYLSTRREKGGPEVEYQLKAASMGVDWIQENLRPDTTAGELPDLFLSAGFDLFFDESMMGHFRRDGVFSDLVGFDGDNPAFAGLGLQDPEKRYSVVSVVPAMFLVNTEELNGRPVPRTWEDILHPRFENSVSLPVGDFDLFNAILLNIHKTNGDEGVKALGRSLLASMHPSQMVKSDRRKDSRPAVTIMPYFFSRMVKEGGTMEAVWPEDGAIISPIFMLAKASKADELQDIVDFFASREIGEVLAHQGLFPSTHPGVENHIPENAPFRWLGWDYIMEHDLAGAIAHCEAVFNGAVAEVAS